jgi:hypothetical protein
LPGLPAKRAGGCAVKTPINDKVQNLKGWQEKRRASIFAVSHVMECMKTLKHPFKILAAIILVASMGFIAMLKAQVAPLPAPTPIPMPTPSFPSITPIPGAPGGTPPPMNPITPAPIPMPTATPVTPPPMTPYP